MPRIIFGSPFGLLCAFLLGSSFLFLTGCGMGTTAVPNPVALTVSGRVHGGQQPVVGAHIQLYVVGSGGNGSAASPLLTSAVDSGPGGNFSITGDYSCPSATAQVYLVATQGNPGLGSGNNPALAMMTALGSCGNLSSTQFIVINEVTTVAAAWALAPFTRDISDIGASSSNARGLANAFLNAQLIADTSTGLTATLPSNLATETGKIYALADAMASCINSNGANNSDGTGGCHPFFAAATPSGASAPTNTWDAVINIVKNPGNNVDDVFGAKGPQPPFPTTLTAAPHDWTLSLTVTGGGLNLPEGLAVDSQGNVWVTNRSGIVSAVNPQGTPLSAAGFGSANAGDAFDLTIDPSDNIWTTLDQYAAHGNTKGSIEEFSGVSSGAALGTPTIFTDNTLNYPYAIAADSNGTLFIANYYVIGSATNLVKFNPMSNTFTAISTDADVAVSVALAPDASHGVWLNSGGNASLAHYDASGNMVFKTDCCGQTDAVAVDSAGMVWLADTQNSSADDQGDGSGAVTLLASDGTVVKDYITSGGITVPSHIAIDAAQNVWISNLHTNVAGATESISELAGSNSSNPGAALSPSTGYGLDADLDLPYGLAVDPSGDVWVSSTGNDRLVMFFGMATPTKTPMPPTPQAP